MNRPRSSKFHSASGRTLEAWMDENRVFIQNCAMDDPHDTGWCVTVILPPREVLRLRDHLNVLLASFEPGTLAELPRDAVTRLSRGQ